MIKKRGGNGKKIYNYSTAIAEEDADRREEDGEDDF